MGANVVASASSSHAFFRESGRKGGLMTYAEEWKAILSRVQGLMQAGELHARFLGIR
jgi:hypothetical protein